MPLVKSGLPEPHKEPLFRGASTRTASRRKADIGQCPDRKAFKAIQLILFYIHKYYVLFKKHVLIINDILYIYLSKLFVI